RSSKDEDKSADKSAKKKEYLSSAVELFIMIEFVSLIKIKDKEQGRDNRIIDAVFKEWIGSRGKKTELPAEKNEGGDIPAHDEHTNGCANQSGADKIYITKVLRCEKK